MTQELGYQDMSHSITTWRRIGARERAGGREWERERERKREREMKFHGHEHTL